MLGFLLVIRTHVLPRLSFLCHTIKRLRDELSRPFVVAEVWSQQVNVRHGIVLLLIASFVEFPLVDVVKVTDEIHFVIVDDLFDTVLRVADDVQKFVMKKIRFGLFSLF